MKDAKFFIMFSTSVRPILLNNGLFGNDQFCSSQLQIVNGLSDKRFLLNVYFIFNFRLHNNIGNHHPPPFLKWHVGQLYAIPLPVKVGPFDRSRVPFILTLVDKTFACLHLNPFQFKLFLCNTKMVVIIYIQIAYFKTFQA